MRRVATLTSRKFLAPLAGKQTNYTRQLSRHQQISGAVAGDSSLQDRGVAHYLLSLFFSLVSLPFSLYYCVPYKKIPKILVTLLADAIFTMCLEPPKYGRMYTFQLARLQSICARAKNPTD